MLAGNKTLNETLLDKRPEVDAQPNAHWRSCARSGSLRTGAAAEGGDDDPRREISISAQIPTGQSNTRLKDRQTLLMFFDLPADHRDHCGRNFEPDRERVRDSRHRTIRRAKGALSQDTARLMVFKLVMAASKTHRRRLARSKPAAESRSTV